MISLLTQHYRGKLDSGVDLETLPGDESSKNNLETSCDTCHVRGEATAGVRYCEDCSRVMCVRHEEVSCHCQHTGNRIYGVGIGCRRYLMNSNSYCIWPICIVHAYPRG